MYKSRVIHYFQSASALARALHIARASVSGWGEIIPEKRALQIERITSGALSYDPALYGSPAAQTDLPNSVDDEEDDDDEGDIDLTKYYNV